MPENRLKSIIRQSRSRKVEFYASPEEYEMIERAAAKLHLASIASYARMVTMAAAERAAADSTRR